MIYFTDAQLFSPLLRYHGITGNVSEKHGADIVNRYVLDFFNKELEGADEALISGQNASFPKVKFQRSGREIVE
ncbi:hypothetical protein [Paenibacillus sp. GCM10012306]|uniref:hypothetical protein n=1 Tax=Paenibacillus sp. GCM10012306 TaxID=3317342 RepID=UPI003605B9B8